MRARVADRSGRAGNPMAPASEPSSREVDQALPTPLAMVVDEDLSILRLLRRSLSAHGYQVLQATCGNEAMRMIRQHVPDVVLMDLQLPDVAGLEVIRRLRQWSRVPILVLSDRCTVADAVSSLDAGADDYLDKPFELPELLARLRVARRHAAERSATKGGPWFKSGPLRVDLTGHRVWIDGAEVHLTVHEYRLLTVLIEFAGRVATHRQLLSAVWGTDHAKNVEYLRVYIGNLRKKLEPDRAHPRIFLTEGGVGYRLRAVDPATANGGSGPSGRLRATTRGEPSTALSRRTKTRHHRPDARAGRSRNKAAHLDHRLAHTGTGRLGQS